MGHDETLQEIKRKVDTIYEKLFEGNGKPALVTRVELHDKAICGIVWLVGVFIVTGASAIATALLKVYGVI